MNLQYQLFYTNEMDKYVEKLEQKAKQAEIAKHVNTYLIEKDLQKQAA